MPHRSKWLVETDWLESNLNNTNIVIFDASWYLPNSNINALEIYSKAHIPNAHFFDIDAISEQETDLPHMLPKPDLFASHMQSLGVSNSDHIIIYDQQGLFSAARVWWTFRVMGHDNVSVLNGGLRKWQTEQKTTTDKATHINTASQYNASFQTYFVKDKQDLLNNLNQTDNDKPNDQVIDARPHDRFTGKVAEPRPGLKKGHIPGSLNIPFSEIINEDGSIKSNEYLTALFDNKNVNLETPIITSCGSGVTAAIITFALALIGHDTAAIYDGAWAEWGADKNTPVQISTN